MDSASVEISVKDLKDGGMLLKCKTNGPLVSPLHDSQCKHFDVVIFTILLNECLAIDLRSNKIMTDDNDGSTVDVPIGYLIDLNNHFEDVENKKSYSFLCINCFLKLVASLSNIFKWLIKFLSHTLSNQSFFQQKMLYYQFLFIRNLTSNPFILKFIMQRKCIYESYFIYSSKLYKHAYIETSEWHLYKEKQPPLEIENEFPFAILVQNHFNNGFFYRSCIYWNKCHVQYLASIGIEQLFDDDIIEKMWKEYNLVDNKYDYYLKYDKNILMDARFYRFSIIAQCVSYFIVKNYILKYKKQNQLLRRYIYLLSCKGKENKMYKNYIFNRNINNVLRMCEKLDDDKHTAQSKKRKEKYLCYLGGFWKYFNALIHIDDNITCYKEIIFRYRMQENQRKICMAEQCNQQKYVILDQELETFKRCKFWTCKGCQIAVYCSRRCQKYHWKHSHKYQCKQLN